MGPGRVENQPQPAFSSLSIISPQPCLDGLELEGCIRVPHRAQGKTCLEEWERQAQGNMYL